jgi:tRNA wybutosine-synthesizing protein 1
MTPSLGHCTQSCVFCWRATPENLGVNWDQSGLIKDPDNPEDIVDGCLSSNRQALSGFGGNPNVKDDILEEAKNPVHVAISLEGEPTLYPRLGELVEAFKGRGFKSVFIVTNGTKPNILSNLETEPSQLYVSVCAPDEETYRKVCRPLIKGNWCNHLETLEFLNSFSCPTVLRHTLVPGINMDKHEGYGKLVELSNPTYLEPKGAMSVGYARNRFGYEEMAWIEDIRVFAEKISEITGYQLLDEQPRSNIVLLSRLKKPIKLY